MIWFLLKLLFWLLIAGVVFFILGWLFRGTRMHALIEKVKGDLIDEQQRHREAKHRYKEVASRESEMKLELGKRQGIIDDMTLKIREGSSASEPQETTMMLVDEDADNSTASANEAQEQELATLREQLKECHTARAALDQQVKASGAAADDLGKLRLERDKAKVDLDKALGAVEREASLRDTLAERNVELQELRRERDQLRERDSSSSAAPAASAIAAPAASDEDLTRLRGELASIRQQRDDLELKLQGTSKTGGEGQGHFLFGEENLASSPEEVATIKQERDDLEHQLNALKISLSQSQQYLNGTTQPDDLTQIKGVAEVLNAKLNSFGIFTYRQIADWDEAQCTAFDQLLAFSGRISRDDWKGQARTLNEQKYGPEPGAQ